MSTISFQLVLQLIIYQFFINWNKILAVNQSFSNNVWHGDNKILLGIDDFKTLRLYGSVFIDKSEMINEYLERGGVVLINTRPCKWGKSINLHMFKSFFEIEVDEEGTILSDENKENGILFTGGSLKLADDKIRKLEPLKVAQYISAMEHLGQNPVILISFKEVDGETFDEFENSLANVFRQAYKNFPYLKRYMNISSENAQDASIDAFVEVELEKALKELSKFLFKHFKRNVYIFIDDFDTPIVKAYLRFGYTSKVFNKITTIIYRIIKKALKNNWYLERGILTGTFHFGWINEILSLNNIRHSTIVDVTFSPFYGFTEAELNNTLTGIATTTDMSILKEWYNGYYSDRDAVFNPWSVLSYLANGRKVGIYWGSTENELVTQVSQLDSSQEYLHQLLQGRVMARKDINKPINLANIEGTFHRVLLFGGYFHATPGFCEANCYIHPWNLSLPNREVRSMVATDVGRWTANKLNMSTNDYNNFTSCLVNLQIGIFTQILQKYLVKMSLPKQTTEQQNFLHKLISGIFSSLASKFKVESNRKPGQQSREYKLVAYPDVGTDVIITEYKITKNSKKIQLIVDSGMEKLLSKRYNNENNSRHIRRSTMIFLVVSRKKVAVKYHISEVG